MSVVSELSLPAAGRSSVIVGAAVEAGVDAPAFGLDRDRVANDGRGRPIDRTVVVDLSADSMSGC